MEEGDGEAPGSQKSLYVSLLPAAQPLLEDGAAALAEYDAARLSALTPEEREQFAALSQKVQASLRQSLRHFCPEP